MRDHGRYDYHPLPGRPDYSWPDGRRLAVYLGLNLEHFAFGEGLGAELAPGGPQPDVLNYAWRDYGNRVGAWRLLRLFDELGLPASVLVNSAMYDYAPALVAAFRARGDEIVGHGRTNSERQGILPEADERALIAEATALIARHEGESQRGLARAVDLAEPVTPDLLAEAGYSLHAGLVPRRPADLVPHPPGRAHPVGALSAGAERHSADRRPQAGGRRLRGHDRR